MELDTEFDFADIVDALDPNKAINKQPLSLNIGVDTSNTPKHGQSSNPNHLSIPISPHILNNTQINHHNHDNSIHHNQNNHHQQIPIHSHSISSSQSSLRLRTKPKPKKPKTKTIGKSSFIAPNTSHEIKLESSSTASNNNSNNIHNKRLFSYNTHNSSHNVSNIAIKKERDLSGTNELLNKLRKQKQDKSVKLNSLMIYKTNNDIFGLNQTDEATLKCPWCGDSKGYRYITKHLYLKCNQRQTNMNQCGLLNTRVLRSTRKDIDYKQYMNDDEDEEDEEEEEEDDVDVDVDDDDDDDDEDDDEEVDIMDHDDDDEETEDDYTMNRYENTKRYNRNIRQRRNHNHRQKSDDDDDYSPQRRSKRKR